MMAQQESAKSSPKPPPRFLPPFLTVKTPILDLNFAFLNWSPPLTSEVVQQFIQADKSMGDQVCVLANKKCNYAALQFSNPRELSATIAKKKLIIQGHEVIVETAVHYHGVQTHAVCKLLYLLDASDERTVEELTSIVSAMDPLKVHDYALVYQAMNAVCDRILAKGYQSSIFGSFAQGFRATGASDMDINISFDAEQLQSYPQPRKVDDITPETLYVQPITYVELLQFTPQEQVALIGSALNDPRSELRIVDCKITYVEKARCPIICISRQEVSIDVSINNEWGCRKSDLLDLFAERDRSGRMMHIMQFFRFWAKSNGLISNENNCRFKRHFNSYIMNHILIHFVQIAYNKQLVRQHMDREKRCDEYNSIELFMTYREFFKDLFIYLAGVDYSKKAIYLNTLMAKETVKQCHGIKPSALIIMDPLDPSHNIAASVTSQSLSYMKVLVRYSLHLMKHKDQTLCSILYAEANFAEKMRLANEERLAASSFVEEDGIQCYNIPTVLSCQKEMILLFTYVLRWDVSAEHQGGSVIDLESSGGITFLVHVRAWVGRRAIRRQLLQKATEEGRGGTLFGLNLEFAISRSYEPDYLSDPIAIVNVRVVSATAPDGNEYKCATVQVLSGNSNEIRDAMHFALHQFIPNHSTELIAKNGFEAFDDELDYLPNQNAAA